MTPILKQLLAGIAKAFGPVKPPQAIDLARAEFEESQRKLLEHAREADYHNRMVDHYQQNIRRLNNFRQQTLAG